MSAPPRSDQRYQSGFGNEFATEALAGALPVGRNSPQRAPYGLYAEQLSGHRVHRAARATTGARGSTASGRRRMHRPFAAIDGGRLVSGFDEVPHAAEPAALGSAADAGASRPTSSTAW